MKSFTDFIKYISIVSFYGQLKAINNPLGKELRQEFLLNTKSFFAKNITEHKKNKEIILIDLITLHPRYLTYSLITGSVLMTKHQGVLIGLIFYPGDVAAKIVAQSFGCHKFYSIYSLLNFKVILHTVLQTLNALLSARFTEDGFLFYVDKMNYGDFIYDEYLRSAAVPTKRSMTLDFLGFIYKSLYIYISYKRILAHSKATKVVVGHNVYATWGGMYLAAKSLGISIEMYNWHLHGDSVFSVNKQLPSSKIEKNGFYYPTVKSNSFFYATPDGIDKYRRRVIDERSVAASDEFSNLAKGKSISWPKFLNAYQKYSSGKNIFIFCHAFVDAVKYPRWAAFPDFYTWLETTLITLVEMSAFENIYVKSHPASSLYPNVETVSDMVTRINHEYGANFICLDDAHDNHIIYENSDCIITSSGTVSIEAPLHGVPVICCGEVGNELLGYTYSCPTKDAYLKLISRCDRLERLCSRAINSATVYHYWLNHDQGVKHYFFTIGSRFALSETGFTQDIKTIDDFFNKKNHQKITRLLDGISNLLN